MNTYRAALGQVVSDMSGVVFGQTIDKFARDLGLPPSGLTDAQQTLLRVRGFRLAGMTLGVAFGCFVGMVPLLFYDLDKREREEKNAALEPLMRSVVDSCVRYCALVCPSLNGDDCSVPLLTSKTHPSNCTGCSIN